MRLGALVLFAACVLCSCSAPNQRRVVGEQCDKNSDCDVPLVCRLGHCRTECRTSADCIAPRLCVVDEAKIGSCQLDAETTCVLQSECPAPLVCQHTSCVNECATDRDCLAGAACVEGACYEPATRSCAGDGDCVPDLETCRAGRCRPICRESRDCRNGWVCELAGEFGECVAPPQMDGSVDASVDAADAGPMGCTPGRNLSGVTEIALGDNHACAVADIGGRTEVVCWGNGDSGVLGVDMGAGPRPVTCPVVVPGLVGTDVAELALGGAHSCARMTGGEVFCWGLNALGALGVPAVTDYTATPTLVVGVSARGLAAGGGHTCATRLAMDASCWGLNDSEQLGIGPAPQQNMPVTSTMVTMPIFMAAGLDFTCAVSGAGRPTCFGNDAQGQRGLPLGMLSGGQVLGAGLAHACAAEGAVSGPLYCWGRNAEGQLGDGTTTPRAPLGTRAVVTFPSPVPPGTPVTDVVLGDYHSCARLMTGELYCWGRNSDGQAVPGGGAAPISTPTEVMLESPVFSMDAGARHTCVAMVSGEVRCWGANLLGQLGEGSIMPQTTIRTVISP